jgi:uncharacterized membrane protein
MLGLKRSRIIVYPPTHPFMLAGYLLVALLLLIAASLILASLTAALGPGKGIALGALSSLLVILSPLLSLFNVVLKRLESPHPEGFVVGVEFRTIYGVPVPVPTILVSRRVTTICINLGGGVVPIVVSLLFLYAIYEASGGAGGLAPALYSVLVTSIATIASSRAIPGIGIVVPTFIPPIASSLTVLALEGPGPVSGLSAYVGGSLGSLIGADVLRLLKDFRRINSPLLSIGGAGVFDGVFVSGVLGLLLAL